MSFESDLLRDSAARLFTDLFDKPSLDARPRPDKINAAWAKFDDAGLPLAAVAEAHGGVGASLADAMALIRLCGAHAVPSPLA
ncbi:MAG: acyl-CoA dehydrogenase, partial [Hyphomicrobium sp.]|nr:acyl-CoA dehydrogenase [Hyphomicrobium sp.]